METLKRAQVVMLPTDKKYNGIIVKDDNKLELIYNNSHEHEDYIPQHLYITSDDKIKEGDWIICVGADYDQNEKNNTYKILKYTSEELGISKIIATTDTSLKLVCQKCDDTKELDTGMFGIIDCDRCYYKNENKHLQLPQPSQQFIEKFIFCYNLGEIITDVLVEYEKIQWNLDKQGSLRQEPEFKLKINPKDNTITIKKLKDSWNREEVKQLLWKAYTHNFPKMSTEEISKELIPTFDRWIKENL